MIIIWNHWPRPSCKHLLSGATVHIDRSWQKILQCSPSSIISVVKISELNKTRIEHSLYRTEWRWLSFNIVQSTQYIVIFLQMPTTTLTRRGHLPINNVTTGDIIPRSKKSRNWPRKVFLELVKKKSFTNRIQQERFYHFVSSSLGFRLQWELIRVGALNLFAPFDRMK